MGTGKLSGKPDEMLGVTLGWTCIPSREELQYSLLLPAIIVETAISSG